jgi:hypothetical protein
MKRIVNFAESSPTADGAADAQPDMDAAIRTRTHNLPVLRELTFSEAMAFAEYGWDTHDAL